MIVLILLLCHEIIGGCHQFFRLRLEACKLSVYASQMKVINKIQSLSNWHFVLVCFFIAMIMVGQGAFCAHATVSSSLTQVNKRIDTVQSALSHNQRKRQHLQANLASQELVLAKLTQTIEQLATKRQRLQAKLGLNRRDLDQLQASVKQQQSSVAKQLVQMQRFSRQPFLKLLLNPQVDTGRLLHYYQRIYQAYQQSMQALVEKKQALLQSRRRWQKTKDQLSALLKSYRMQNERLVAQSKRRQTIIQSLNQSIQAQSDRLQSLMVSRRKIQQAIGALNHINKVSVKSQLSKGQWAWPVSGRLIQKFGTNIDKSKLRYKGVLISAPEGQAVHAVESGTVIFAKWMAGYGLLLIIDHGGGYYSLYGRNQRFQVVLNQRVAKGDVIANVGQTGGFSEPALYFSLRQHAQAIDPVVWCNKKQLHGNRVKRSA